MNYFGNKYTLAPIKPTDTPIDKYTLVTNKPAESPIKKYRAITYDKFDEMYANKFKHLKDTKFNQFTDGLIDETFINRYSFLQAIDDYKALYKTAPFSSQDEDMAFNYRPYNMW